ncbi:MAG: cell division protein FtsQ/DivIB [Christensenellaceae bacterium]|jgi:cell division septal protein FtsQ
MAKRKRGEARETSASRKLKPNNKPSKRTPKNAEETAEIQIEKPRRRRKKQELVEPSAFVSARHPATQRHAEKAAESETAEVKNRKGFSDVNKEVDALIKGKPLAEEPKKRFTFKTFLWILVTLCALAGIAFLGYKYIRVQEIDVVGNVKVSKERIAELSEIPLGKHILKLDRAVIKEKVERDPHVLYQSLRYHFPSKVTIVIEEREEAACFAFLNVYVITDATGMILGHSEAGKPEDLPQIKGISVLEYVLGEKIKTDDTLRPEIMESLLKYHTRYELKESVASIDLTNVNAIVITLKDGTQIKLGSAQQLEKKYEWIYSILDTLKSEGKSGGMIDVSSVKAPVYVEG